MDQIKSKTITCEASMFDEEFSKWQSNMKKTLKNYELVDKISITHDGNNHYILYHIKWNLPLKRG